MNDLSKRLAALSPEKLALLQRQLGKAAPDRADSGTPELPERVIPPPEIRKAAPPQYRSDEVAANKPVKFSLFFFACDEAREQEDKYQLLRESAAFADANSFYAVWTPERHFNPFGGLYPSPSLLGAALAMITSQIQIRAGSVVLPLQHPIRVAEEWAVVDCLSHGRAGLSVASGWHPNDFVLSPESYAHRREIMFDRIATLRKLWAGEPVTFDDGAGASVPIEIYPKPLRGGIPIWVTSATSVDTWLQAAKVGANVLTALLGQSVDELATRISLYRQALAEHGHDPNAAQVTLMVHTFVGDTIDEVRHQVKEPFSKYLRTHVALQEKAVAGGNAPAAMGTFTEEDRDALVAHAYERYFNTGALFGTPESCLEMIGQFKQIGVDEIGCLIDFGVDSRAVVASLARLNELRERSNDPQIAGH